MSSSIVIALPKIEDAKKIRTILNRHGLTVASVCSSVSNALASISELDSGVLICGYKLTDAYYKDALDNLPQYFEMLLLASQRIIDEAPNSVSTVQMPMKASVLIDTVNDMLYHLERRIKKEKKKPKPRSEKEQNYISNAKRLLMEKNQMTEEEAYRHIQKCSMDSGTNMVETAQMLLMLRFDLSYVLNKTSENNRKNFVKNDDIILTEYVVIYRIYFCSYQVRGKIHFNPNIILYIERIQTNIK